MTEIEYLNQLHTSSIVVMSHKTCSLKTYRADGLQQCMNVRCSTSTMFFIYTLAKYRLVTIIDYLISIAP